MVRFPLNRFEDVVLIAIGGFDGANLRFLFDGLVSGPGATFAANVLGCLLLGFILHEALATGVLADETRLLLSTGFLASLTTYSTFALKIALAASVVGLGIVIATYGGGIAAIGFGGWLARHLEPGAPG